MESIFCIVDDAEVYIDDIGAFSPNLGHHVKILCTILTKLQENGFAVNLLKCDWAVKETDWQILTNSYRPYALEKEN
jgi:hypothetical protein